MQNIINECREKWTRRIVNKREVKEYNVVFDKRIVLSKGEDTIPYGFHWIPSTNETVVQKSITPVPDTLLYTLTQPSSTVGQQGNGIDLMTHDKSMVVDRSDDGMASNDDIEMMGDDDDEAMDTHERYILWKQMMKGGYLSCIKHKIFFHLGNNHGPSA